MYTTCQLEVKGLDINENIRYTRLKDRVDDHFKDIGEHYRYSREVVYNGALRTVVAVFLFNEPCGDE